MTKQKNFYNQAKFDTANSTFKQIIYLDNSIEIIGYSKKIGYNERFDKIVLLKNWIIRMYETGYLNPEVKTYITKHGEEKSRNIEEIIYYLNDHIAVPVFSLTYKSYQILYPEWANNNFKIIQFLDTFYKYINEGMTNRITRLKDNTKSKKMDLLDVSNKRFFSNKQLNNWIHEQHEKGNFSKAELTAFYYKYLERHLPEVLEKINAKKDKR